MNMKGEFRDVLKKKGEVIEDKGWRSNEIVPDFGNFLAALMKKDFKDENDNSISVGIEYIAVGGGSKDQKEFEGKVFDFFKNGISDQPNKPYQVEEKPSNWVWAKKIGPEEMKYVSNNENTITNTLQIEVKFDEKSPENEEPLNFEEFALLGYNKQGTKTNPNARIFFIDYATHGIITKEKDMTITRTIKLTFPIAK